MKDATKYAFRFQYLRQDGTVRYFYYRDQNVYFAETALRLQTGCRKEDILAAEIQVGKSWEKLPYGE